MEICVEKLSGEKEEKLTPKMVRRLLGIENKEIAQLCRQISLIPKRDEKGQTYFSKEDVDVLQKLRNLQKETQIREKTNNLINYVPAAQRKPAAMPAARPANTDVQALNQAFASIERKLLGRISRVIDDKLDGMDEVVVELIRCKTENETLRQKLNDANKEVYELKNELNSFRPVGFNLYLKKNNEFN